MIFPGFIELQLRFWAVHRLMSFRYNVGMFDTAFYHLISTFLLHFIFVTLCLVRLLARSEKQATGVLIVSPRLPSWSLSWFTSCGLPVATRCQNSQDLGAGLCSLYTLLVFCLFALLFPQRCNDALWWGLCCDEHALTTLPVGHVASARGVEMLGSRWPCLFDSWSTLLFTGLFLHCAHDFDRHRGPTPYHIYLGHRLPAISVHRQPTILSLSFRI